MGIDPTIVGQIQAAADLVVLDSLDTWNLHDQSVHTQADFGFTLTTSGVVNFDNLSTKAQTYSWDFGDGQVSTDENPTVTYGANGNYTVTLTATSECNVDIVTYQVDVQTVSLLEGNFNLAVLKSLGNGQFIVKSDAVIEMVQIADAAGNQIKTTSNEVIDLSHAASGLYLVRVTTDRGEDIFKLVR